MTNTIDYCLIQSQTYTGVKDKERMLRVTSCTCLPVGRDCELRLTSKK